MHNGVMHCMPSSPVADLLVLLHRQRQRPPMRFAPRLCDMRWVSAEPCLTRAPLGCAIMVAWHAGVSLLLLLLRTCFQGEARAERLRSIPLKRLALTPPLLCRRNRPPAPALPPCPPALPPCLPPSLPCAPASSPLPAPPFALPALSSPSPPRLPATCAPLPLTPIATRLT